MSQIFSIDKDEVRTHLDSVTDVLTLGDASLPGDIVAGHHNILLLDSQRFGNKTRVLHHLNLGVETININVDYRPIMIMFHFTKI